MLDRAYATGGRLLRAGRLALAAAVVGLVSACVPSLYPAYTADTLAPVAGIEGGWTGPDGMELVVLARKEDGRYRAIYYAEGEGPVGLDLGFTEIAGSTYADFSLTLPGRITGDEFVSSLVGAWHGVYRMKLDESGAALTLQPMSVPMLDDLLDANPGALAHARTDRLRLLAETSALRAFIADTPALFDTDGLRFERAR